MDKLIADLLEIERAALEDMGEADTLKTAHTVHAQDEINKRVFEVKRMADKELQAGKQKVEADTQAQLDAIEAEHSIQTAQLKSLFETNAEDWRSRWVARILQS